MADWQGGPPPEQGGPPAGWYPDPEQPGQQRYWDGQQWTEHRAPLAPQPAAQWSTPGQSPAYTAAGQQEQNQKALWSMILGILGLVCCGLFTGIPALILGHLAKQEIAASGGRQSGGGMAQAGFILGIVSVVLSVLGFVLWIVMIGVGAGTSGF